MVYRAAEAAENMAEIADSQGDHSSFAPEIHEKYELPYKVDSASGKIEQRELKCQEFSGNLNKLGNSCNSLLENISLMPN